VGTAELSQLLALSTPKGLFPELLNGSSWRIFPSPRTAIGKIDPRDEEGRMQTVRL
jgi:hypothetical protein